LHVPPRPGVVRTGFSGGVHAHPITASGAMLTGGGRLQPRARQGGHRPARSHNGGGVRHALRSARTSTSSKSASPTPRTRPCRDGARQQARPWSTRSRWQP